MNKTLADKPSAFDTVNGLFDKAADLLDLPEALRTKLKTPYRELMVRLPLLTEGFIGDHQDIPGPDMGTNAQVMAWIMDRQPWLLGWTLSCRIRLSHRGRQRC